MRIKKLYSSLTTATFLLLPTSALAVLQVDMTPVIEKNSMLVLFLFFLAAVFVGGIAKHLYGKMEDKLDKAADESTKVELRLKEAELNQLHVAQQVTQQKLDRIESECHACQKVLPSQYVTKPEFDKLVATQREDIHNITSRLESIIKDLKSELRSDMELQIERIIALLEKKTIV